ncbi:Hypothetical predicted protein [Mytilus galloprovincialis]|uniref:Caspase family p20 domain-containing protein n=1 Tax=Mytilus galloprovincialis TaxID=29158 RepID=A0A8B6BWN4_MYTGA|nr:Hypothetical predicted protein [Mytilus galloprovincialis]
MSTKQNINLRTQYCRPSKNIRSQKAVEDIFDSVLTSASSKLEPTTPSNEYEYDCSNRYRGLAIIICNENFKTERLKRYYCDNEIKLMEDTFGKHLNFTVLIFKDLTAEKINWVIQTACKQPGFYRMSDCFACVLASHGGELEVYSNDKSQSVLLREHCIYGVDNVPVSTKGIIDDLNDASRLRMDDATIPDEEHGHTIPIHRTADEFDKMSYSECPSENKPSLNAYQKKVSKKDTTEASIFHKVGQLFGMNKNEDTISILDQSCTDDTLVVYSSASEKISYGNTILGGWMLVSLKKAVAKQLCQTHRRYRIDFMDVLNAITSNNAVNFEARNLNPKYQPLKTTVVYEHCFYKELNFYIN